MRTESYGGARYALTVLDDYSRYSEVFCIEHKSDAADKLKEVIQRWENRLGSSIQAVRSDGGGEFIGKNLRAFFADKGIQHQLTAPYSPEQNGKAERLNRTLQERARAMLYESGMEQELWAEAFATASYLRNLSPVSGLAKTPWELFHGVQPDISHLRIFGCLAYPLIETKFRDGKTAPVSYKGYLVGYEPAAYRVYLPNTRDNIIIISANVKFDERLRYGKRGFEDAFGFDSGSDSDSSSDGGSEQIQQKPKFVIINEPAAAAPPSPAAPTAQPTQQAAGGDTSDNSSSESDSDGSDDLPPSPAPVPTPTTALRRSTRVCKPVGEWWRTGGASANTALANAASSGSAAPASLIVVPQTVQQALASPQAEQWKQAMDEEMQSLLGNNTYELTPLPYGRKAIPCKWVFALKTDASGNVVRFKARLVAKGFAQREGIDYTEVFAPVSKHTSLRTLLALSAAHDLEMRQIDVKTAYLNGILEEDIYMMQPPGYEDGGPGIVCKLSRSLYGLKQAGRVWYERLCAELIKLGFKPSTADPALFTLDDGGVKVFLLVYVDDCLIVAPQGNTAVLDRIISDLQSAFDLKDMGEVSTFLGIGISRDRPNRSLSMSQSRYITDVLGKYNMLDARPRSVPLCVSTPLQRDGRPLEPGYSFSELIGSLLYLSICTRPDIAKVDLIMQ
jgi:hypothetical protein